MTDPIHSAPETAADRELVIDRLIDAPRERVFAAWTNPALLAQWFAPAPITTPVCEIDARPGGVFRTVMRAPDGTEFPTAGVFLEVVAPERIVFTDAFTAGWQPNPQHFMTAVLTLTDEGGKTRYHVSVRHWSAADRERHEAMGFEKGWNQCIDQLTALVTGAGN